MSEKSRLRKLRKDYEETTLPTGIAEGGIEHQYQSGKPPRKFLLKTAFKILTVLAMAEGVATIAVYQNKDHGRATECANEWVAKYVEPYALSPETVNNIVFYVRQGAAYIESLYHQIQ